MNYLQIVQASSCSKISGWSPGVILETFQDFPDLWLSSNAEPKVHQPAYEIADISQEKPGR